MVNCGAQCDAVNAAPTATGVSITGTATVGQTLTGTYTYADDENDAEGTSTFKWYSGTDAACAEKTEVGTAVTYTVADADKDKYLCFEVTPVATTGTTPGTAVMSAGVKVTAAATSECEVGSGFNGCECRDPNTHKIVGYLDADAECTVAACNLAYDNCRICRKVIVEWYDPADITTGTALSSTQLNADASYNDVTGSPVKANGTFTYTPPLGTVLSVGNAQNLTVHFVPADPVTYCTPADKTVQINVIPPAPIYSSDPAPGSTIDVGSADVNASVSKPLSVSETGNAELQVTSHALTGTNAADFSVTPATLTVEDGGAAQDLTIKCTPSAAGVRTATLTVTHNAADSPATYTLTCTGKVPGDVDGNGKVEFADAILALKIMAGIPLGETQKVNLNADVDGDGKIGTAEVIYILDQMKRTGKLPGDVDGNGRVEFADAVLALQITDGSAISPEQTVNLNADVDGDGKIGMAEVVYILAYLL